MHTSNMGIRRVGYGYQVYDVRTGVGASRTVWATLDLAQREQARLIRRGF